jgi:adenylate cyclase
MNISVLIAELRRRRVFRVVGIYAVLGWLVVQIAATTFPVLMLPDWSVRLVVALFLLGLPVVVVLAWMFDITPDGVERTQRVTVGEAGAAPEPGAAALRAPRVPRRIPAAAIAVLVVTALGMTVYRYAPLDAPRRQGVTALLPTTAELDRSIVVLPFADISAGGDQEWFSDGLTEELLNTLAQVPGLRVAARTSSFAFKGQNVPIDEVARRLNVAHVLEGSVRRSGERLRITAQLVSAADGYQLWSRTYDRRLEDIFDIQDEISGAIAAELRGRLGADTRRASIPTRMTDPETYDVYLRGRFHWRTGTLADVEQALALLHEAIARDSSFALAWVGLADAYTRLAHWGHRPPREMLPPASAAAARAVALDSLLPAARASRAQLLRWWDHDRVSARREFLRALELDPHDALIHEWYGWFLADEGRIDEAIEHFRRAAELDPLSYTAVSMLGNMYVFARRWEDAIAQFDRGARMPGNPFGAGWRARPYSMHRVGRGEAAIAELEGVAERNVAQNAVLGHLYAATGRTGDARRILAELRRLSQHRYVAAWTLAFVHVALGEYNAALDELERSWQQGSLMPELNVMPEFEPLHGHPRYRVLLRRLGLETGRGEIP